MNNTIKIDHHITGNHPTREITEIEAMERGEPRFLVRIGSGFEPIIVAVYGAGLCEGDAEEAVEEFYPNHGEVSLIG